MDYQDAPLNKHTNQQNVFAYSMFHITMFEFPFLYIGSRVAWIHCLVFLTLSGKQSTELQALAMLYSRENVPKAYLMGRIGFYHRVLHIPPLGSKHLHDQVWFLNRRLPPTLAFIKICGECLKKYFSDARG